NKGEISKAEDLFCESEEIQKENRSEHLYLYSLQGFQFCDLQMSQGKYHDVQQRAKQTIDIAIRNRWLLAIAVDKLSLGRAYLLEAVEKMDSTSKVGFVFQQAADELNQAVAGLRQAGAQEFIARGLFSRAFFYRVQNDFPQAWDDLEEAREIAERDSMNLYLADYHLEASRLLISDFGIQTNPKS
ncbi:MAG: hypothetical protein JSW07_19330, partial [bacterium]